jgi:hypothetical protein
VRGVRAGRGSRASRRGRTAGGLLPCRPAMKSLVPVAVLAAAEILAPRRAHAIRPDYDGERGLEAFVTVGYGSLVNLSERVFQSQAEARLVGTEQPRTVLTGSLNSRLGVGYRIFPLVSVGFTFQYQILGTLPVTTDPNERSNANAWSIGGYVRFYPLPLFTGTWRIRRVNFMNLGDGRRFEPWISVGADYNRVARTIEQTNPPSTTQWSGQTLGIPVTVGFDYRIIPPLAVGIAGGVTPWVNLAFDRTITLTQSGNWVTLPTESFGSAVGNAAWFVGASVRGTFSF